MAEYLRTGQEEGMRQATDSWRIFAREKKCIDVGLLVKYHHSITTQNVIKAIEEYETGSSLLQNYKKNSMTAYPFSFVYSLTFRMKHSSKYL
jgi:hypothetical protein